MSGQQHPNLERGFDAAKVYQFGNLDHVNVFNGNVSLTIPIGQTYSAGGNLSYGWTATYNSKVWDYEDTYDDDGNQLIEALGNRRSNAGLGWFVSLGQLIDRNDPTNNSKDYVYVGADGAEHTFYKTLHYEAEGTVSCTWETCNPRFTRDGSYLRMIESSGHRTIEFPDGRTQTFQWNGTRWRFFEIRDRFGNFVQMDQVAPATVSECANDSMVERYTDSTGRISYVCYKTQEDPSATLVHRLVLPAYGAQRAVWTFNQSNVSVERGCGHELAAGSARITVPLLDQIVTPSSETFDFRYSLDNFYRGGIETCQQGAIERMRVPTGGAIEWTWQPYNLPAPITENCAPTYAYRSTGIHSKKLTTGAETDPLNPGANDLGTWKYEVSQLGFSGEIENCQLRPDGPLLPRPAPKVQHKVVIIAPDGDKEAHYFSIWPRMTRFSQEGYSFDPREYGLPLTRRVTTADGNLFLSRETFDCENGSCALVRSAYVRYESDITTPLHAFQPQFDANRRLVRDRTIFNDDPNCGGEACYVETIRSSFDGVGHYRMSQRWSNFPGSVASQPDESSTTQYLTWTEPQLLDLTTKWILERFTEQSRTIGGSSAKTLYHFSPLGFLLRKRTLRSAAGPGEHDLLTVFTDSSGQGNVEREEFFGGDLQTLSTLPLATMTLPTHDQYSSRIDHTYDKGSLATSTYWNNATNSAFTFKSVDKTIDTNTGLASSSRDTAGVSTVFAYDKMGRMTSATPTGSAATTYTYTAPTATSPAQVEIVRSTSDVPAVTAKMQIHFDPLGRVNRERRLMPDNVWTERETKFTLTGRRDRISEWQITPSNFTVFNGYDPFGRPAEIVAPDGKATTFTYLGAREVKRSVSVKTLPTENPVATTTQTYDSAGRLITVVEPGGNSTTTYTYDAGDRVESVTMTPSASGYSAQPRSFDYDDAGLLNEEEHPEKGVTTYAGYDARGHARLRTVNGANSQFDLKYTYDGAERLVQIDSKVPDSTDDFRVSKEFHFGTANLTGNKINGKLAQAIRHNYVPGVGHVSVTEKFTYGDDAGRMTSKTTEITDGVYLNQTLSEGIGYNELDMVKELDYPACESETVLCGARAWDDISFTYDAGYLETVERFADDLGYAPSGMVSRVEHSNDIVDTFAPDPNGMARPESISFATATDCTAPNVLAPPASQSIPYGSSAMLTVNAPGTDPRTYQWMTNTSTDPIEGATTATYVTPPLTESAQFWVRVINSCGRADSDAAVITVVLPAPSGLNAIASSTTQVAVWWTASANAHHYELERLAFGLGFVKIADVFGNSYVDTTVSGSAAYVYRVRAVDADASVTSGYSNSDIATTIAFSTIVAGVTDILPSHFDELLSAVNAVRYVIGSPGLSWTQILPAGVPAPARDVTVLGVHITSVRDRMNAALQALGFSTGGYTDPVLDNTVMIKRIHVVELQERAR